MTDKIKSPLVVLSIFLIIAFLMIGLGSALYPLIISFSLAYLIFPIVEKLESKGIPRTISLAVVLTVCAFFLILLLALLVPQIISESKTFIQELPENSLIALKKLEFFLKNYGVNIDLSRGQIESFLAQNSEKVSANLINKASGFLSHFFTDLLSWFLGLINLFLVPLFLFYIINDYEKIKEELTSYIPNFWKIKIKRYLQLANVVLSGYIRGQLLVALILSCLYGIGLSLVGLRFGLLIGIITGLLSIIPYVGFSVGFATSLMMAFANYSGTETIVGLILVFLIVQAMEGMFITPKLVGNKVGLSALMTMLSLIIGGNIAGLFGMLVAIPLAAILKNLFIELKLEYIKSIK
ncbi:MAG: AI-2E family transporter [Bdellovibrionales bacterium]|nr:AI-2E family transporter [Bdellovibrionales bacterium]